MHIPACIMEIFLSYPSFFTSHSRQLRRFDLTCLCCHDNSEATPCVFLLLFFSLHPTPQQALERGAGATVQGCLTWAVEHQHPSSRTFEHCICSTDRWVVGFIVVLAQSPWSHDVKTICSYRVAFQMILFTSRDWNGLKTDCIDDRLLR